MKLRDLDEAEVDAPHSFRGPLFNDSYLDAGLELNSGIVHYATDA